MDAALWLGELLAKSAPAPLKRPAEEEPAERKKSAKKVRRRNAFPEMAHFSGLVNWVVAKQVYGLPLPAEVDVGDDVEQMGRAAQTLFVEVVRALEERIGGDHVFLDWAFALPTTPELHINKPKAPPRRKGIAERERREAVDAWTGRPFTEVSIAHCAGIILKPLAEEKAPAEMILDVRAQTLLRLLHMVCYLPGYLDEVIREARAGQGVMAPGASWRDVRVDYFGEALADKDAVAWPRNSSKLNPVTKAVADIRERLAKVILLRDKLKSK